MRATKTLLFLAGSLLALPVTAHAGIFEIDGRGEIVFEGTVQYRFNDTFEVVNPDGSRKQFTRNDLTDLGIAEGDTVRTTFSFSLTDPAFALAACSGNHPLGNPATGGSCALDTRVTTPFGSIGFGGTGGDSPSRVTGLAVNRDQSTGEFSLVDPTGDYSLRYVAVPNYQYDSATGVLSGLGDPCVSAFNCFDDIATGNLTSISFPIDITGDFGLVRPGLNVGYNAGRAGFFDIIGGFRSSNGPTPVPAPGGMMIFALGAALLAYRRKFKFRRA